MKENKAFKGYYIIVFSTFLVIVTIASVLAYLQFRNRFEYEKSQIRKQVSDNIAQLNTIINIVNSNLFAIQEESEFYLRNPDLIAEQPLYNFLSGDSLNTYFHTDLIPDSLRDEVGNIHGLGDINELTKTQKQEINIILKLNPLLNTILHKTPNVVLVYSSFQDSFINLHPFIPTTDFRVDESVFNKFKVTYADVYPDKNPQRAIKWTESYIDDTGKGLMVTAVIPIYRNEDFQGLAGIDFTLDSLNNIINRSQRKLGETFLVNDKKQLLAHPRLVSSDMKEIISATEAFPKATRELTEQLNYWEAEEIHLVEDYIMYYNAVPGTPWNVVYVVSLWEIYLNIFFDIGISTLFILISISSVLIITSLYTRKRFIQPAQALVHHIQRENSDQPAIEYIPPAQWKPWFSIITSIFQRNRNLINKLKENNNMLEQKVQERTQEIAAQNEELIQNQEEITSQRDYIKDKNQELELINEKLIASESILRKSYQELSKAKENVSHKNKELETRNKQIKSSINAALSIQTAMLPYPERMKKILGEYFVIYKPRDIVSGDFYWLHTLKKYSVLVTADCTGHGVPGALMSMIGSSIMDKVIALQEHTDPGKILEYVHKEVSFALKQESTKNNNSMDMSVLVMEDYGKGLTLGKYAGAKTSMYFKYPKEDEVIEVKGTRRAIGGIQNLNVPFETREIIFRPRNPDLYGLRWLCGSK